MKQRLITLGFSDAEADLYIALLKLGEATIAECVKLSRIPRSSAYPIMRRFVDLGLVAEVAGKPARFCCLPPESAFYDYLSARLETSEQEYLARLENLRQEYTTEKEHIKTALSELVEKIIEASQEVYDENSESVQAGRELMILRGQRSIIKMVEHIKIKECVRITSPKPYIFMVDGVAAELGRKMGRPGITEYVLCESYMLGQPNYAKAISSFIEAGHPVKQLPSLPIKMDIYDNTASLVVMRFNNLPDETIALFVRNKELISILIEGFESLWSKAIPVKNKDIVANL